MGIFGGLKQGWKDGSLLANLQAAGAMAPGDHASARPILAQNARTPQERGNARAQQPKLKPTVVAPDPGTVAPARITTPRAAARAWQGLGVEGQAAFERWLNEHKLEVAARSPGDGTASP